MRKKLPMLSVLAFVATAALAVPPGGPAGDEATPASPPVDNPAHQCQRERALLGEEAFRIKWATPGHPTGANAFGKCVDAHSDDEPDE